jgi:predicted aspartyl protease
MLTGFSGWLRVNPSAYDQINTAAKKSRSFDREK